MDDTLRRLATLAGIEEGYWDALGTRRELTEATACALLAALGVNTGSDRAADVQALEIEPWIKPLRAVVCVAAEQPLTLEVVLETARAAEPVAWQLILESGVIIAGIAQPEAGGDDCVRVIDGRPRVRCQMRIDLNHALAAGYHRLELPELGAACSVIAAPARCHTPPALADGGRCFGIAVQLYGLRSRRNWGIGDFSDLAEFARSVAGGGGALIGVNPLHARHLVHPAEASPYAPSSRLMIDPIYLDVEAIADFAWCAPARTLVASDEFQQRIADARATPLVDHAAVTALKLTVLRLLYASFSARRSAALDPTRSADFDAFVAAGGADLAAFASFEALRLSRAADGVAQPWRNWPIDWQHRDSAALGAFRRSHADDVEFQLYLQWQADAQLAEATATARAGGMQIGLYRDLAVGAADDGAETWANGALVAAGISVGAPPDLLNRQGQDWGLPPWNPRELEARAYVPFANLIGANMRHAGALRIDHVMALTRLFWIPAGQHGDSGAYVRQAFEVLTSVLALESVRHKCLVIGEDLGSVPEGLREALAARGLLSYRVLIFERHWAGDGHFKRPHEYPHQALATVVTHDMPTIADYWAGGDIPRRDALGLFPTSELASAEAARRADERERLLALLAELGLRPADPDPVNLTQALHAVVAESNAMLAVVQFDDIAGEVEPANIPGTYHEYPNWRRKVSLYIEDLACDPRWLALVRTMREAGRTVG